MEKHNDTEIFFYHINPIFQTIRVKCALKDNRPSLLIIQMRKLRPRQVACSRSLSSSSV